MYSTTQPTPKPVKYVHHPSFNLPVTEERLWGADREEIPRMRYTLSHAVKSNDIIATRKPFRLTAAQEKTLFLRYNYAKYRLKKARESGDAKAARRWDRRRRDTQEHLLEANLPLVPAMAKRKPIPGVELAELIAEGNMAVLRCIESFDVSRGFKFSTYACRAIYSAFRRRVAKQQTYRKHVPVQYDPELEGFDQTESRHEDQLAEAIDMVRDIVHGNQAGLTETERKVLLRRFPMDADAERRTLKRIGQELDISSERVRQIELACLSKVKVAIQDYGMVG